MGSQRIEKSYSQIPKVDYFTRWQILNYMGILEHFEKGRKLGKKLHNIQGFEPLRIFSEVFVYNEMAQNY